MQENPFENVVWKMSAILSRPQYVNTAMTLARFHAACHIAVWTKAASIEYIIWEVRLPLYGNCELSASMHYTPMHKANDAP